MKKILFIIIFILCSIGFNMNVYADCSSKKVRITDITLEDKSDTTIDNSNLDDYCGLELDDLNIVFNKVGDYVKYKITILNDTDINYELDLDILERDYVKYEVIGDTTIKKNKCSNIYFKITYINEVPTESFTDTKFIVNDPLNIELNDASNNANNIISNPKTGTNLILVCILLGFIITLFVILFKFRKGKYIIPLIVLFCITSVYASEKLKLSFNINLEIVNEDASLLSFIEKAKNGKASTDDLGKTFDIDMGDYGIHTLRVANVTTPSECSTAGFSQTACGVVLEFADIITEHIMNEKNTSLGGWPASSMYSFVNNDIYNALPEIIRNNIIDTYTVSGHGTPDSTNFTSIDKLYLLSPHEIWEDIDGDTSRGIDYEDAAYNNTRQLDYYSSYVDNSLTFSCDEVYKENCSTTCSISSWWLRSAGSTNWPTIFFDASSGGCASTADAMHAVGVSPAFRVA